ncbi:alpha/beta hydrolase [Pontibacillus litoralis]|uniref:Serine aminopeptidase S33 domain-containing protein n=1 Tax=Pontibacillus litoralis JSM 072002 TaxID=1385512 RepID=A0A0A5FZ98_9BACI|nr:alpha/beta hydrolase [Pontibacillus litoralis]KGX85119.1 hypothetical protein N784_10050 [Pontibacillus litoralis JSM 072002]
MKEQFTSTIIDQLKRLDHPINFYHPTKRTKEIHSYLQYYQLDFAEVDFHLGVINVNAKKVMVQMHIPKHPNGTVLLLHGYFDHIGHLRNVIEHLLVHNKRVIVYDLEGHGLSAGALASVESFTHYQDTLEAVITQIQQHVTASFSVIAHSTGAAIMLDYLLHANTPPFTNVIAVAPLIRSSKWHASVVGHKLISPFIQNVRRKYRANSADVNYLSFVKADPLQYDRVSFQWFDALQVWYKRIRQAQISSDKLLILQGTDDKTVDWRFNLNFLHTKFPNSKSILIDQGQHQLWNEEDSLKEIVLQHITNYLEEKN